jgi:hypothetical protein
MEPSPQYNFRDVLWAPARALSAKQILVMTASLVGALAVYDLFTYLAWAVEGENVGRVFAIYGFFPFRLFTFAGVFPKLVFGAGIALAVFGLMLGFLAVAAINVEAVRGNRFFSARQAIRFALSRFKQLFLAEVSIVLFVLLIILLFVLLGLVTRLPVIGEWIYVLLFAIPNFVIALLSVFIVFVFTLTVLLLPAVAAAERKGETFTAILETFSTMILQPFRWAGYTVYSFVMAKVCGFIFAYFAYRAVQFLIWSASLGGGDRINQLAESGLAHLPSRATLVRETFNVFPGVHFGVDVSMLAGYPSREAVVYAMSVMLFLVFASILGYMLAIVAAAQARGYVALRFIKDGYSIAAEEPLFFTDEPVNDEVDRFETGNGSRSESEVS